MNDTKFGPKQIALTALLLAICIVSQYFKNISVFITGPIINTCIALTVLFVNLPCGIVLSIITPITAYLITGMPVAKAVPGIIGLIIGGNIVLALGVHILLTRGFYSEKRPQFKPIMWLFGFVVALAKGLFMGATISYWLLPTYLPEAMQPKLPALQTQFSIVQFVTALIGMALVFILFPILRKVTDR